MTLRISAAFLVCGAMILAGTGCGGGAKTGGNPVAVGGTITLDGQPLEGATINFSPVGEGGQPAHGLSGSGGTFRLTTRNSNDGAVPGEYRVTVAKQEGMGAGGAGIDPKSPDYMKMMEKMSAGGKHNQTKDTSGIHANYREAARTPLKFTIPSGGDKNLKIELNKSGT